MTEPRQRAGRNLAQPVVVVGFRYSLFGIRYYLSTSPITTSMLPTIAATSASSTFRQTRRVIDRLQNDG
jgi:hypothetical protein